MYMYMYVVIVLRVRVHAGSQAYFVARNILGHFGEIAIMLLSLLGTVSVTCAEVIAMSSIIVYDIYQTYVFVREVFSMYLNCGLIHVIKTYAILYTCSLLPKT